MAGSRLFRPFWKMAVAFFLFVFAYAKHPRHGFSIGQWALVGFPEMQSSFLGWHWMGGFWHAWRGLSRGIVFRKHATGMPDETRVWSGNLKPACRQVRNYLSISFTTLLTSAPSALPLVLPTTTPITFPKSATVAFICAMVSAATILISSSPICAGM